MNERILHRCQHEIKRILSSGLAVGNEHIENEVSFVILHVFRDAFQQSWSKNEFEHFIIRLLVWLDEELPRDPFSLRIPMKLFRQRIRLCANTLLSYSEEIPLIVISTGKHIPEPGFPRQDVIKFEVNAPVDVALGDARLGEPPSAGRPPSEARHLCGQAPTNVGVGAIFDVLARIDINRSGDTSSRLAPLAIPASGLIVTLNAICGPESQIALHGTPRIDIVVLPGIASDQVKFSFKAIALGTVNVTIRAFTEERYIGDLQLWIDVGAKGGNAAQEVKVEMRATAPVRDDATLEVEFRKAPMSYSFRLRGSGAIGVHKYERPVDQEPARIVAAIMAQLNELARNAQTHSSEGIEATLVGIGTDLWTQLLPPELQAKFIGHWDQISRLAILAADDLVPWELMYCAEKAAFLADHWLVYRRCYGDPAAVTLGGGPACYVLPHSAPPAAASEVDTLRKIFPSERVWRKLKDLLAGLNDAQMGMLHIAAHNTVQYDSAMAISLMLDEPFRLSMLARFAQAQARMKNSPMVFLNACSGATAAEQWVGSNSWASRFHLAGAGAFIGSLWEIRDGSAAAFAETFYENARRGDTLGEAFAKARAAISKAGDPTRFAYTFFGDPDAKLKQE